MITTRLLALVAAPVLTLVTLVPVTGAATAAIPHEPAAFADDLQLVSMSTEPVSAFVDDARELPHELVAAVERDLGLAPAEYLAQAAAAVQAGEVLASLEDAGIPVAGSEMDGTELLVYVTDAALLDVIEQTGATAVLGEPRQADYSGIELEAQVDVAGGLSWGTQMSGDPVTGSGSYGRCSMGFSGYDASGNDIVLTAGHCFSDYEDRVSDPRLLPVSAPVAHGGSLSLGATPFGGLIPGSAQFDAGFDTGLLTTATPGFDARPQVVTYGSADPDTSGGASAGTGAPAASAPLPIRGSALAVTNAPVCRSGSTTGFTCGTILQASAMVYVSGVPVFGIVTDACSLGGDSGGALVTGMSALGVLSGGNWVQDASADRCGLPSGTTQGISIYFALDNAVTNPSVCPGAPAPFASSACPDVTAKYGTDWELMVQLATPVVTTTPGGFVNAITPLSGTLAHASAGTSVGLFLGGASTPTATVDASTGSWSFDLDELAVGPYSYEVRALWGARNRSAAASGTFTISAPAVPVVSGTPGGLVGSPAPLTGTLSEWQSGLTVKLFLDGGATAHATAATSGPQGSWMIPLTGIPAGMHSYVLTTYQGEAALGSASGTFAMVGTHPPTVTSDPGGLIDAPNPLAGVVANPVTNLEVALFLDGSGAPTATLPIDPSTGAFSFPLDALAVGTHSFLLRTMWNGGSLVGSASGSFELHEFDVATLPSRIQGPDRYATAAEIARVWDGFFTADVVFVATGENYPDALSAAAAAAHLGAPVLLTQKTELPSVVASRLTALDPDIIYVLGSSASISNSVFSALTGYAPTVQRIQGDDRYATGREIIKRAWSVDGDGDGAEGVELASVVIATGKNFPDALSAAAAVGSVGGAVVLVDGSKSSIPSTTLRLLRDLDPQQLVIAGQGSAVTSGIEQQLKGAFPGKVVRKAGADRYATSVAITDHYFDDADAVFFAVGTKFPDALAGAALAGALSAPLLVASKSCVSAGTKSLVTALGSQEKVLLGSSASLKDSVASLAVC